MKAVKIRRKTAARGYALVEIVVVIVVAAIVLPAIILPFTQAVQDLSFPVRRGVMTLLAQEEMEKKVIWAHYSDVASWTTVAVTDFPDYTSTGDVIYVQPGAFNTETDGDSGYKRVTVTIANEDLALVLTTLKTSWEDVE